VTWRRSLARTQRTPRPSALLYKLAEKQPQVRLVRIERATGRAIDETVLCLAASSRLSAVDAGGVLSAQAANPRLWQVAAQSDRRAALNVMPYEPSPCKGINITIDWAVNRRCGVRKWGYNLSRKDDALTSTREPTPSSVKSSPIASKIVRQKGQ